MRELDFSENNLFNRLCGVNSIWKMLQGEVKQYVKVHLERALALETDARIGCPRYIRSGERRDYRNGSYTRALLTTYGWIGDMAVPRQRYAGTESAVFGRYQRRQAILDKVLLESFLLGHSTRKTRRLFATLFGESMSAPTVSRVISQLDDEVTSFHSRSLLDRYRCVYLDGLWVTLRKPVKTRKVILVALGVTEAGESELLSFQLAPNESESSWWGFISDLKQRGVRSPELLVTDGAGGLKKAVQALYPRCRHQQCAVHKAFDAASMVQDGRHRRCFRADALAVFEATTVKEARQAIAAFHTKWQRRESKATNRFLRNIDLCLVYLEYPPPLQSSVKSTNPVERYIEEIRRRTIPMRSFNNAASAERIIYGIIAYVLNNNTMDSSKYEFTQDA